MLGEAVTTPAYIAARRAVTIARKTIAGSFEAVDALVLPTMMILPPRIEAALTNPPDDFLLIRNTMAFNLWGIPAISVPCGFTSAGRQSTDRRQPAISIRVPRPSG